jgi:hypothetical protein
MELILQIATGIVIGMLALRVLDMVFEWWQDQALWQKLVLAGIVALLVFSAISNI